MEPALKALLMTLMNKRIIGGRHTPEKKIIKSKTRWLTKSEKRQFDKQYKELINLNIIIKQMKRTKKDSDYHIALNPAKLREMYELIEK